MRIGALNEKLALWEQNRLTRERRVITRRDYGHNTIHIDGKPCLNFSSNDYLGLSQHPEITSALINGVNDYGVGSSASALVSGYFVEHERVEHAFAEWLGLDRAILFSSGYLANVGLFSALLNRDDTVLSDKLCHASLLDGIQLSRAKHYRYRHNDMQHLQQLTERVKPNLIVTESVFSMEGDMTPVADIMAMALTQKIGLVIDDAHGIGVLGEYGRSVCSQNTDFSCVVLPLGKTFNAMGAIVAGEQDVIESILQFSRSYRYTTALPPALCSAIGAALKIVQKDEWRRQQLHHHIDFFNQQCVVRGLSLTSQDKTPIKAIIVGDNQKTIDLQQYLFEQSIHVAAIRPPTVPHNQARLRITLNCLHSEENILYLLDKIESYLS